MHTIKDVCRVLRLGRTSVYELIKSGELEAIKFGRATRITDQALQRFLASRPKWIERRDLNRTPTRSITAP
jgi:excisionase family DNA binding protein